MIMEKGGEGCGSLRSESEEWWMCDRMRCKKGKYMFMENNIPRTKNCSVSRLNNL
jgi:hypothetical protein